MGNTYEPTLEHFTKESESASMEVLLDNGLYRHLRVRFKNGGFGWFDIMTWPGNLTITGDCETFTFSRLEDMFAFFRTSSQRINPGYWQEKVVDGRDRCREFDWDLFEKAALKYFDQRLEGHREWEIVAEAREVLIEALGSADQDAYGAVELIRNFGFDVQTGGERVFAFRFDDPDSSLDGMTWDYHYIWCCRAIAWAINKYDEHHAAAPTTDATTHPA
ncbi:hypothetical protein E4695_08665 [Alcaligenaceae bacterium 429]|nr:hypothetical protein E4695_08665 [Alcaligenaceae bacterium 429]